MNPNSSIMFIITTIRGGLLMWLGHSESELQLLHLIFLRTEVGLLIASE